MWVDWVDWVHQKNSRGAWNPRPLETQLSSSFPSLSEDTGLMPLSHRFDFNFARGRYRDREEARRGVLKKTTNMRRQKPAGGHRSRSHPGKGFQSYPNWRLNLAPTQP